MISSFNSITNESIKQLYSAIFSYCKQSATGTLFLASDENRSGQIVFNQGALLGISYAGEANHQALSVLSEQSFIRQSYSDKLIFPVPETLLPEDSLSLLRMMGMAAEPLSQSQLQSDGGDCEQIESVVEPKSTRKRIYRGHVVR